RVRAGRSEARGVAARVRGAPGALEDHGLRQAEAGGGTVAPRRNEATEERRGEVRGRREATRVGDADRGYERRSKMHARRSYPRSASSTPVGRHSRPTREPLMRASLCAPPFL